MDSARALVLERANAVVATATASLAARLSGAFDGSVAVGLNGSCARGDLTALSDIDFCLVFDCAHESVRGVDLPSLVESLKSDVAAAFPAEPLARRFSVFWSCLDDLKHGHYQIGRFPAYDRGLFRHSGKHIAGMKVLPDMIREPSAREIGQAGVRFLLEEVRPQLQKLGLFQDSGHLSVARVRELGPVLVTKAVLMPVRLLYVLLRESEARPFVSVEDAVRACADVYSLQPWWTIAGDALRWRQAFPEGDPALEQVAHALTRWGRGLYLCCAAQHREFAAANEMPEAAVELAVWIAQLASI